MLNAVQSVSNFLVPATGTTNLYNVSEIFSSTPKFIDFRDQSLDGLPFRPSGVIIDNSQGTGNLVVLINETGFQIICGAGMGMSMPYPAPINHTVNITGQGQAVVQFVDYPVIPWAPSGGSTAAVTIADGADVSLGAKSNSAATDITSSWSVISLLKGILSNLIRATTYIDRSGTTSSTAGTSTVLATANPSRKGFWVQAGSAPIFISDVGAANTTIGGGSLYIPAGGYYEYPPSGVPTSAIEIASSSASSAYSAREW